MTTHTQANIPEYVIVREMDRAIQLAEDAKRLHDQLAHELGFERVRINDVHAGDELTSLNGPVTVEGLHRNIDPSGVELWYVELSRGSSDELFSELFDDGQLVSRLLPPENDIF